MLLTEFKYEYLDNMYFKREYINNAIIYIVQLCIRHRLS